MDPQNLKKQNTVRSAPSQCFFFLLLFRRHGPGILQGNQIGNDFQRIRMTCEVVPAPVHNAAVNVRRMCVLLGCDHPDPRFLPDQAERIPAAEGSFEIGTGFREDDDQRVFIRIFDILHLADELDARKHRFSACLQIVLQVQRDILGVHVPEGGNIAVLPDLIAQFRDLTVQIGRGEKELQIVRHAQNKRAGQGVRIEFAEAEFVLCPSAAVWHAGDLGFQFVEIVKADVAAEAGNAGIRDIAFSGKLRERAVFHFVNVFDDVFCDPVVVGILWLTVQGGKKDDHQVEHAAVSPFRIRNSIMETAGTAGKSAGTEKPAAESDSAVIFHVQRALMTVKSGCGLGTVEFICDQGIQNPPQDFRLFLSGDNHDETSDLQEVLRIPWTGTPADTDGPQELRRGFL